MLHGIIIAGGMGKRLWPKSKTSFPKYLLKVKGKKSLLEDTIDIFKRFVTRDNLIIITNAKHVKAIRKEIPGFPKQNIVAEPLSRNTGPAVSVAAALVRKRDPSGVMFVMPADHIIADKEYIRECLRSGALITSVKDCIVTLGIRPTFPATGYGYIKAGRPYKGLKTNKACDAYKVAKFVEKPVLKKAKEFIKTKRYFWNAGIFIGRPETFLGEIKRYQPRIIKITEKIEKGLCTKTQQSCIDRYYKEFPNISIDYAVMEKTPISYVIKADMEWHDVGSWKSLEAYARKDTNGNIIQGDYLGIDVANSIIVGEEGHLLACLGLDDAIVIHTKGATLVCAKERAQDVKALVDLAQKKRLGKYL